MPRQRTYVFDNDKRGDTLSRNHLLSRERYSTLGYTAPSTEVIASNINRINSDKMQNPYSTLPTVQSTLSALDQRPKIKAIGAFTNMLSINREAQIIDEEAVYLEAVEKGDLEEVEEVLLRHKKSTEETENRSELSCKSVSLENGLINNNEHKSSKSNSSTLNNSTFSVQSSSKIELPKQQKSPKKNLDTETIELCEVQPKLTQQNQHLRKRSFAPRRPSAQSGNLRMNAPLVGPIPVTLAKQGSLRRSKNFLDVETNDYIGATRKKQFNKNCKDQWGRSALFIAMIHQNLEMMDLLLEYQVETEECLYHAIDFKYYDVVDLLLKKGSQISQMHAECDSFYPPGLTPFQLAAHKNDFVMLKLLRSYEYDIGFECIQRATSRKKQNNPCDPESTSILERAWDSSNHQLLRYQAITSPAYLIMSFVDDFEGNSKECDIFEKIFQLYAKLKKKVADEPAVRSLYTPLIDKLEDFACDLLNEVRSSSDLAHLLRFDPPGKSDKLTSSRNHLTPVQRAIEVRMKRFVAHQHSQLAISTLRQGTLFVREHGFRTVAVRISLALIFPILCLVFNIFPESRIGKLLCNPMVNMSCHIMSEITFLLLMIIRLILLTTFYRCDCLGSSPYTIDYFILLWIIARILNQIKKARDTSFKNLITNVWALNDLATSGLFIFVIALKIYDLSEYGIIEMNECPATVNLSEYEKTNALTIDMFKKQCTRTLWTEEESWPITLSESALALIYLLIHIRAMELLYTDRTFGPLQLSLDKMLLDTIRFLTIFFVTFMAFAFAMTQLYWAWGRPKEFQAFKSLELCEQDTNYSDTDCYPVYSFIENSLLEQYWTLYGYGWGEEPPLATRIPKPFPNSTMDYQGFTEIGGQTVSMIFHAWAVVVMLNMLVAMMSHSFDRVRDNAELEWKFHRSEMWMKFIRKGVYPRPPPMNLIPSTRDLKSFIQFIRSKLPQNCRFCRKFGSELHYRRTQQEQSNYLTALKHITNRYMRRYLLPDFRHNNFDQPSTRSAVRRLSSIADDISKSGARTSEI